MTGKSQNNSDQSEGDKTKLSDQGNKKESPKPQPSPSKPNPYTKKIESKEEDDDDLGLLAILKSIKIDGMPPPMRGVKVVEEEVKGGEDSALLDPEIEKQRRKERLLNLKNKSLSTTDKQKEQFKFKVKQPKNLDEAEMMQLQKMKAISAKVRESGGIQVKTDLPNLDKQ